MFNYGLPYKKLTVTEADWYRARWQGHSLDGCMIVISQGLCSLILPPRWLLPAFSYGSKRNHLSSPALNICPSIKLPASNRTRWTKRVSPHPRCPPVIFDPGCQAGLEFESPAYLQCISIYRTVCVLTLCVYNTHLYTSSRCQLIARWKNGKVNEIIYMCVRISLHKLSTIYDFLEIPVSSNSSNDLLRNKNRQYKPSYRYTFQHTRLGYAKSRLTSAK